jgi:hypothetical protein
MNRSFSKLRHIQESNILLEKRLMNESHNEEVDESYWNKLFGSPTIKDATHDSLRGQGHSHTSKDESNELYVVFKGQNFYPSDIEYADPNDMGEIPRIEDDKLIVANPTWSL